MKKIIIIITLICTPLLTQAQTFFDTLEDMDGVNAVILNKDAFEIMRKFKDVKVKDNNNMKAFEVAQGLENLKFFSTDDSKVANKMEAMVKQAIKKQNLTELMRVKQDDSRVKIYVQATKNKDVVSEVLMFIKGVNKRTDNNVDSAIISLSGKIDINKMSELADTFSKASDK